jgi:hypothetical protein
MSDEEDQLQEKGDDAVFPYHGEDEESGITNRELFFLVALHATIMKGEPEDVTHNAIVALRQADAAMKQLIQ